MTPRNLESNSMNLVLKLPKNSNEADNREKIPVQHKENILSTDLFSEEPGLLFIRDWTIREGSSGLCIGKRVKTGTLNSNIIGF
eukprot:snap_masked-scaffold_7-processed-gene-1.27-mRNA-1 protein AED:1.00 eAED:1.00 QI:0/-1/0/0/-1/1/1/0/83